MRPHVSERKALAHSSEWGGLVDGLPLGPPDTQAFFGVQWDTTAVRDGRHTITLVARDTAGHVCPCFR